ncbi:hypothetical protein Syun_030935 [Stephania yunnanensis]|uniref:Uncharacterized protein n=1 Tax=Stephania yunnanensis TaxID=152371 RepID=A0AAP0E3E5_9MAGN
MERKRNGRERRRKRDQREEERIGKRERERERERERAATGSRGWQSSPAAPADFSNGLGGGDVLSQRGPPLIKGLRRL